MEKLLQTLNEKPIFLRNAFLSQSNPLPNNSKLPENQTYITETKLSSFDIEDEDICKIIKALGINKAHGHYEVSIRMLKLCDESVVKPLSIILKNFKLKNTYSLEKNKYCFNSQKRRKRSHKKVSSSFTFTNIWKIF